MSPTSYQTAPPRNSMIAIGSPSVKHAPSGNWAGGNDWIACPPSWPANSTRISLWRWNPGRQYGLSPDNSLRRSLGAMPPRWKACNLSCAPASIEATQQSQSAVMDSGQSKQPWFVCVEFIQQRRAQIWQKKKLPEIRTRSVRSLDCISERVKSRNMEPFRTCCRSNWRSRFAWK